jgi:transaldolase
VKIFIDTADLRDIREACQWGIIDGLTTNPTLIRHAVEASGDRVDMQNHIEEICRLVPGPVSLEVVSLDASSMVEEACALYRRFNPVAGNVTIKIPVNTSQGSDGESDFEGLKAITALSKLGIPVNATLVMTPEQALLCAKAGATYVSPFMGRVDDYAKHPSAEGSAELDATSPGCRLVEGTVGILRTYRMPCEVIAASVRHPGHVRAAELCGAQIATLPFRVLVEIVRHPKTAEGIRRFCEDVVPEYAGLFSSAAMA